MEEARKRCAGTPFSQPSAKRPASAATDRASPVSDCSASPYDNGDSSRTSPEPSFVADAEPPELVELVESAEFLLQEQARELQMARADAWKCDVSISQKTFSQQNKT
jgi:hypothetical protein